MTVAVSNASSTSVDEAELAALADFVLAEMHVDEARELSVRLVDEPEMTRLHVDYMDEPGPTDVLAFPMDEEPDTATDAGPDAVDPQMTALIGDVVLCPSIAAAQGETAGHAMRDELHLLCTHGILHLLGYDHHDPQDEREMFGLQAQLLAAWSQTQVGGRS